MLRSLAKLIQGVAALAVLSGSACARRDGPTPPPARRVIAVSDLIGRSPSEVAAALTGKRVQNHALFVSAASLEDGREVLFLDGEDLKRTSAACDNLDVDAGAGGDRVPLFRFVARRLASVDLALIPMTYDAPSPDAPTAKTLRSQCAMDRPMTLSDVGMVIAATPIFAASTPEAVKLKAQYFRGDTALSELSLGAPVPGGAPAFAGAHPSVVKAVSRADGALDLQIDMGLRHWAPETHGAFVIHVLVRDGRIVSFAKGYLAGGLACRLDGTKLHCQPPDFYQ